MSLNDNALYLPRAVVSDIAFAQDSITSTAGHSSMAWVDDTLLPTVRTIGFVGAENVNDQLLAEVTKEMLVSFVLLLLSLTAISNAQAGNEENEYWWQRRGRYTAVSKVESEVYKIHHLLDRLKTHLRPALNDLRAVNPDGTPNISNAYATFFTDTVLVPQVDDILTKVTTGVSMLPETKVQYSLNGSPVIMSVVSHGDFRYVRDGEVLDAWDYYLERNKTETAVWLKESPYILLFPFFWEANPPQMNGDVPPPSFDNRPAWNCLIVDRSRNRFRGNDDPALGGINSMALIQWRTWVLMEQLLYYYIHYTRGFAGQMLAAN
ncbi:MAG: hypothetical protein Q9173_006389, partial [Seirophora scorigena]